MEQDRPQRQPSAIWLASLSKFEALERELADKPELKDDVEFCRRKIQANIDQLIAKRAWLFAKMGFSWDGAREAVTDPRIPKVLTQAWTE
eukprot:43839-Eustigmatos_ZCMA.PRE.1